jgi:hypothetical protein
MNSVNLMSRWTMNAHQHTDEFVGGVGQVFDASVAVCDGPAGLWAAAAHAAPWDCPEPVLYDEEDEDEDEDEAFGDDEDFADDEEYEEEDDDFLEDDDEEFDDEESEDEEEEDDDEF